MLEVKDYLQINDTRLLYSIKGEGEPLVFLHGGLSDLSIWDYQVDTFACKYKVIRYDQRGYGKSDIPTATFSYYDDLKSLIEALELKRVSVIGSSFGGSVAIDFALKYPELIKSLILIGPAVNGYPYPSDYMKQAMDLYLTAKSEGPEAALEKCVANNPFWGYFFPSPERKEAYAKVLQIVRDAKKFLTWNPMLAAILEPVANMRLREIHIPTLIVLSDKDSAFNLEVGEYIHQNIENSKKVVIPDCGHLPYVEKPEEFNRIALSFLDETI